MIQTPIQPGHALQENGDLTAAIAFNTAPKLNPNDTDAHNNLGHAGDLTAAIASSTAPNINPNHTEALNNLGTCLKNRAT